MGRFVSKDRQLGLLCFLLLSACSSEGGRADLRVRLAASDSVCTVEDSGALEGEVVLRICGVESGTCVALDEELEYLRTGVDTFESAPIDIPASNELMQVDIQVCQGESVIAFGSADGIRLGAGVDVVLHRTQSTSCGNTLIPRAFGQALALPNGEVLIFGGVQVDLSGTQGEAGDMVEAIEVYDPASDEARVIEGGFTGALVNARLVSSEGNRHRIRVFGGLDAEPGSAALQISRTTAARASFFGSPVQPTNETRYVAMQDLIYDADAGRVTSELVSGVDATGFNAVMDEASADHVVVFGVGSTGLPVGGGARVTSDSSLQTFETQTPRVGHTLTDTGDGSALVWGGPMLEALGDVQAGASEVLDLQTLISTPLAAPVEEVPTAFHEAASLVPGQVVLAGGLQSICVGDCQLKVSQIYAAMPLRVMTVDGLRLPVGGTPIEPAVFQASVVTADSWVVTGGTGASEGQEGKQFSFDPNAQVSVITESAGEYASRPLAPLRTPRFGHAIVALQNGSTVVFGGVTASGGGLSASGSVEWVVTSPTENLCALSAASP